MAHPLHNICFTIHAYKFHCLQISCLQISLVTIHANKLHCVFTCYLMCNSPELLFLWILYTYSKDLPGCCLQILCNYFRIRDNNILKSFWVKEGAAMFFCDLPNLWTLWQRLVFESILKKLENHLILKQP